MTKPQTLKGFRDFLPDKMVIRSRVINILRSVFEKYGFAELQTPTLEYAETLLGKYGEEAEKLMYIFKDNGQRQVGLKYDLTVPLARVMSQYPDLPKPFKRYQIQPVFRAENTQKGRYREFYQCDIDIVGTNSCVADAEILAIISDCLKKLGFKDFSIKINSRQVLFDALRKLNIPEKISLPILQSLDKLDKKDINELKDEVETKGMSFAKFEELNNLLRNSSPDTRLLKVKDLAEQMGAENVVFFPGLVRGLDYYTSTIFETIVIEPRIGSITGGGRYDNLIKTLGGPDLPAVGTSFGLDRICDVIEELGLMKNDVKPIKTMVSVFSPELQNESLKLVNNLRSQGIGSTVYPDPSVDIGKQVNYARSIGAPTISMIGPNEVTNGTISFRAISDKNLEEIDYQELLKRLKALG